MIWTPFNFRTKLLFLPIWLLLAGTMAKAEPPKLILPTDNDGLLTGNFAEFYQYVQRDFDGQVSQPWEGGQYGFVRDPRRIGSQIIYTRFHEGIDIRPLHRDAAGEPEDVIHAIAAGTVVYTNPVAGNSNYGRYVVIEHHLDGFPYYSLYAHLNTITVKIDESVSQGSPIAVTSTLIAGTALSALKANTSAYFQISVTDANGIESALSNEACKTFPASTPGTVTITIS